MANTLQTIKLAGIDLLPNVAFNLEGKPLGNLFEDAIAAAMHPGIPKEFLTGIGWDRTKAIESIKAIFTAAIVDSLTSTDEIADIMVDNLVLTAGKIMVKELTLATIDPMEEQYARTALAKYVNADAAMLIIESDIKGIAKGVFSEYIKPTASIDPRYADLVQMWQVRPMEFANMVYDFGRQHPSRPWNEHKATPTEEEAISFMRWAVKNFVKLPANVTDPAAAAEPAATPDPQTAEGATAPTEANTNNQTTPTPMAQTANTNIPAGYKVAPAIDPANPEAIASQFKTQFEKALSAVSPSGAKLADCTQVWTATTRPNDLPGRIITCKVVENEQTYHVFTFDCKDRHRDSTTYDEGMRFDWLSVDAMIKAFNGQASVLDCVKDSCKKRLMGPAAAPAPKAATKTATDPQPQTATTPAEGATAPTEATAAPAPMPKAQTKSAPAVNNAQLTVNNAPQTAAPAAPQTITPQTPAIFKTYENPATPSYLYHLYGDSEVSGFLSIRKKDGAVIQHSKNQTTESSLAIIERNGMTEVTPIPDVVITALIKEGVIKTPMQTAPQTADDTAAAEQQAAAAAKAAEEQAQREAAERAEQERIAKEQAEAAERERKERERKAAEAKAAAEKAERERLEREKREAEERAEQERLEREKREAEEQAKREAEEKAAAKRGAQLNPNRKTVRHPQFDRIIKITDCGEAAYGHGPSGTGKTHIAQQMAEHYGLPFTSNGCIYQPYELIGYMDANGNYHETAFIGAVRNGGMHLFDEFDRSCPQAPVICNSLLANGFIDLPNGERLYMHKDFHLFACGNTIGTGADADYTAAQPLEVSTLDRFTPIEIDYDEQVELSLAKGDVALVEFVHEMRRAVEECHYKHLLSYRAIIRMVKFMQCFTLEEALQLAIVRTMSRDDARNVCGNMNLPNNNRYMTAFRNVVKTLKRVAA